MPDLLKSSSVLGSMTVEVQATEQYKKQFNIIILAHAEIWCEAESEVQVLE